jgi:hypothetical protein
MKDSGGERSTEEHTAIVQQTSLPGRQGAGKLVIFVVEIVGGRKQAKVGWVEGKVFWW